MPSAAEWHGATSNEVIGRRDQARWINSRFLGFDVVEGCPRGEESRRPGSDPDKPHKLGSRFSRLGRSVRSETQVRPFVQTIHGSDWIWSQMQLKNHIACRSTMSDRPCMVCMK